MAGRAVIRLNAPKGLGDAICLRAVALHIARKAEAVEVFTPWPEVFEGMPKTVRVRPQSEIDDDNLLRHVAPCSCHIEHVRALDQFTNARERAGVPDAEFDIGWTVRNRALAADVRRRAGDRRVVIYQPIKRANTPDQALLRPHPEAFNRLLREQDAYLVRIGHPGFVENDPKAPCDLDLFGRTTVSEAFDLVAAADGVVTEPCFLSLLAQALDRSLTCMFSRRALASENQRVSNIRPQRIFHKQALCTAVWDEPARKAA